MTSGRGFCFGSSSLSEERYFIALSQKDFTPQAVGINPLRLMKKGKKEYYAHSEEERDEIIAQILKALILLVFLDEVLNSLEIKF